MDWSSTDVSLPPVPFQDPPMLVDTPSNTEPAHVTDGVVVPSVRDVFSSIHNPANVMAVDSDPCMEPAATSVDVVNPSAPIVSDPMLTAILQQLDGIMMSMAGITIQNQRLEE